MKITCQLLSHSNGPHVQQTYTGFLMLERRGLVRLEQRFSGEPTFLPERTKHLRDARRAHLSVLVNGTLRLHYDAHDSWEIDAPFLEASDYYFKRSFSPRHVQHIEGREKVHPLGLYYNVYPDGLDWRGVRRNFEFLDRENWRQLLRPLDAFNWLAFTPRVSLLESLPPPTLSEPKVLFMARAWNPFDTPDRPPELVEQFDQISEVRAAYIRALKETFGRRFYGGFIHMPYARKRYPDLLMPDAAAGSKSNYLRLLQDYPICIATTGLMGSIGAKLGEYVAGSKAIVSEPLHYEPPGDFQAERNFLEFAAPEECVAQVQRLFGDEALRREMMVNNARYYQRYLRPDVLILNSLLTALGEQRYDWNEVEGEVDSLSEYYMSSE